MWRLLVSFVVFLGACTLNEPKDLRFDSLSVVNARDERQLMNLEKNRADIHFENLKLLKIVFSSTEDIVRFAKTRSYNVGYAAYLCDADAKVVSEVFSAAEVRLVNGGKSLGGAMYFEKNDLDDLRDGDGRLSYYALIPLESEEMHLFYPRRQSLSDNENIQLYDYHKDLLNICIQLRGGKMWFGGSFSSNLVLIPRSAILRELNEPKGSASH